MGNTIPTSYTKVTRNQTQFNQTQFSKPEHISTINTGQMSTAIFAKPIGGGISKPIGGIIKANIKANPLKHKKCNKEH